MMPEKCSLCPSSGFSRLSAYERQQNGHINGSPPLTHLSKKNKTEYPQELSSRFREGTVGLLLIGGSKAPQRRNASAFREKRAQDEFREAVELDQENFRVTGADLMKLGEFLTNYSVLGNARTRCGATIEELPPNGQLNPDMKDPLAKPKPSGDGEEDENVVEAREKITPLPEEMLERYLRECVLSAEERIPGIFGGKRPAPEEDSGVGLVTAKMRGLTKTVNHLPDLQAEGALEVPRSGQNINEALPNGKSLRENLRNGEFPPSNPRNLGDEDGFSKLKDHLKQNYEG